MIVDPSALLAVLFAESDGQEYADAMLAAPTCRMSAVGYMEAAIRLDQLVGRVDGRLDQMIELLGIAIEPVTAEQAGLARLAYRRYGKGNHSVRLNLGDCFSYALAKTAAEPLLFKGDDFSQTDIRSA